MSAKGLSGKTSFIPEYITIHRFSTKFKIIVSLETKFWSVCVFYVYSALLGDNLN